MGLAKFKEEKEIYSFAEYLKMERESLERHEYIDGGIFLTVGESDAHGDISVNLVGELSLQLTGR
jgi:Uma2 family endonuclease